MTLRLNGSTSGYTEIDAPAVAGSNTLVLPTGNGSSGQYLQTNGSGTLSWSTSGLPAQALTLGTSVASTSGTSIDFTSIPSTVKRITVMFQGVSTNGTSGLLAQLGTSSGPTTSGYLGSLTTVSSGVGSLSLSAGFLLTYGTGGDTAATVRHGQLIISNVTGNNWTGTAIIAVSNEARTHYVGGSISLAAALDRVRITTVSGTDTFDAGTINIMYEG